MAKYLRSVLGKLNSNSQSDFDDIQDDSRLNKKKRNSSSWAKTIKVTLLGKENDNMKLKANEAKKTKRNSFTTIPSPDVCESNTLPAQNVGLDDRFDSRRIHINTAREEIQPATLPSKVEPIVAKIPFAEEFEIDSDCIIELFSKIRHNHIADVKDILHKYSIPSSIVDDSGNSMLHVCCQNNLKKMAGLAISVGCEVNVLNNKKLTPLDYAKLYKFDTLAAWLKSKGCLDSEELQ